MNIVIRFTQNMQGVPSICHHTDIPCTVGLHPWSTGR